MGWTRWLMLLCVGCATSPAPVPQPALAHFSEGMTRPVFDKARLLAGVYTREMIEQGIAGQLIVKCSVMADGQVRNCRVLRPLPRLAEIMVRRLESSRMEPSRRDGVALSVDYVFNFVFRVPEPASE